MPDPAAYYEGDFLIAGATPDKDKNDDGTHTASTASTASILVTPFRDLVGSQWTVDFNRFCCVRAEWI